MKKLLYHIFLPFAFLSATTINIPADYSTIQDGISASVDGDTVLVADGVYYENLIIDKDITLASHFIIDGNISHRDATIIDGSNYDEASGPFGSCVLFMPPANGDHIHPQLTGFTIQNGLGTRVRDSSGDETITYYIGGGLMMWYSLPEITYNYIRENGSGSNTRTGSTKRGGGASITYDNDDVEFDEDRSTYYTRTIHSRDDEIVFSNNIFENNDSETGNTFESLGYVGDIDFSYSEFDVFSSEHEDVSEYWVVKDDANAVYTGALGVLEAITDEAWISPTGLDSSVSTGTIGSPFKTIDYAFSRIYATADNHVDINLTGGTYGPDYTGEDFPIIMISNVNLIGQGEEETIIDADLTDKAILFSACSNILIANLTVQGGHPYCPPQISNANCSGGGMSLWGSNNIIITNVTIKDNVALQGGGVYLSQSHATFTNVTISNNKAEHTGHGGGGGINVEANSSIIGKNMLISYNKSNKYGGGIYFSHVLPTSAILNNVTVYGDTAAVEGGGIYGWYSSPQFINSIIWGNVSPSYKTLWTAGGCNFNFTNIEGGNIVDPDSTGSSSGWECSDAVACYGAYNGDCFGDGVGNNDGLEGNILDEDPQFTNAASGDFTLQEGSSCIDGGEYNVWNLDPDGSTADMGYTGGYSMLPNFIEYEFGEIGDIVSTTNFKLYNFGDDDISINDVSFSTNHFTTSTDFPIVIPPLSTGAIDINCLPDSLGQIEDSMIINSPDQFIDGLSIALTVTGSEGNLLGGELSGTLVAADYRVTSDIVVEVGNTLIIDPGAKLLFDGECDFIVEGVLKAQGTESDSIIFDNYNDDDKWRGFTMSAVTNETVIEYARISGADKGTGGTNARGGGVKLEGSSPILRHVVISRNSATRGGGLQMLTSSPTLDHVIISGNISTVYGGGFDYRTSSYPTIINSIITENDCIGEPGYCNTNAFSGGGQGSILTVINSIIRDNGDPSDINNPLNGEFGITSNNFNANYSILPDSIYLWPDKIGLADFEEMEDIIGVGNIIEDPLFVDPDNGDYSLSWENYPDQDSTMSPCIDAGTADLDGDGEDDIEYVGAAPDMGAFEYGALPAVTGFMFYTFDTYISLTWDPANQDGFQYYLLERSTDEEFAEDVVSNELVSNYYEDDSLEYDTEYFYRVSYYAGVQQSYYSEVLSVTLQWLDVDGEKLPTVYAIHQNYPNPFNPTTQIKYDLPEDAMVSITIYDIMGRSIKSLVNSNQSAGYRSIQWNATNNLGEPVSAGLYLYTIEAGKFRQTKKMVLLK